MIKISGYPGGTTVANVEVELQGVTGIVAAQHMLVAPTNTYNLDFFDAGFNEADSISTGINLNFYDTAGQYPNSNNVPTAGNYEASDSNNLGNLDTFGSTSDTSYDSSIPQVPATVNLRFSLQRQ